MLNVKYDSNCSYNLLSITMNFELGFLKKGAKIIITLENDSAIIELRDEEQYYNKYIDVTNRKPDQFFCKPLGVK